MIFHMRFGKEIYFTQHAKRRLKIFGLSELDIIHGFNNAESVLFDTLTGNFIAIKAYRDKRLIIVYNYNEGIK